ncbi:MAG: Spy/CpxP family protein refolding chaperone [Ignavibacteria bacterium]|nr:Spy/CpxP family protein refolding chaperone [Ignavibacteria bacterium]
MKSTIALFFLAGIAAASAQHHTGHSASKTSSQVSPKQTTAQYAGEQKRSIKALSDDMIDGYRLGRGMGMAKAAELNHYPGPMHILDMKATLKLTQEQTSQLQAIFEAMHTEAVTNGNRLIDEEQALDDIFTNGMADSSTVQRLTARIGELQAKIRFAHLNAHIRAQKILSKEQIALYDQERGYTEGAAASGKKLKHKK